MRRITILIMVTVFGIVLATACASKGGTSLVGTDWELELLGSSSPLPGTQITLRFQDGEIEGSAGCNHYFGSYTLEANGSIQLSALASTEMACLSPEGVMEQETRYLQSLRDATKAIQDGDRLTIESSASPTPLVFRRISG